MHRYTLALITLLALASSARAEPDELEFYESFETLGNSTIGATVDLFAQPNRVRLSGNAFHGIAGITELYNTSVLPSPAFAAWMVLPDSTGRIEFVDKNASVVEFYARTRTGANGATVITAFDDLDQAIGAPVQLVSPNPFQLVSFSGDIHYIEVVNNATGASEMNSIDDFGFTPVPEPSSWALMVCGLLGAAWLVRRRRIRK